MNSFSKFLKHSKFTKIWSYVETGGIRRNTTFYNNGKLLSNLNLANFTNAENSENQTFPAVYLAPHTCKKNGWTEPKC